MATVYTVTHDFATDTVAVADYVDANFNDCLAAINALDASNLASGTVPLARISGLTYSQCASAFFKDEDAMTSDSATAVASQQSIKAHVAAAFPDDDAFGSWTSKSNNTNYLAASDGIVCAYRTTTGGSVLGFTDTSSTPTTRRVGCEASGDSRTGSICMPVKKGNYWKVTGASTVYWLPIGA